MRRLIGLVSLVFTLGVLSLTGVLAQDSGLIFITGAWARATVADPTAESSAETGKMTSMGAEATDEAKMMGQGMDSVSAAYMTIENLGDSSIKLVGASTSAAGLVEIHEVTMEKDVMKMRPVEGGIEIPAGGGIELKPGGYHIMLMELSHDFVPGEAISLSLQFDVLAADGTAGGEEREVIIGAPIWSDESSVVNDFVILDAWARPTVAVLAENTPEAMVGQMGNMKVTPEMTAEAGGMGAMDAVSAVYMTLLNRGVQADRLVSVSTSATGLVEIHEVKMENDVMKMRPVEGGIEIPGGGEVELKPGGYHIMLMELKRDFIPGDAIVLTLTFESGTEVTIGVPIYDKLMNMGN